MDTRKTNRNQKCANDYFCENGNVTAASCQPTLAASKACNYESALGETKPKIEWTCRADPGLRPPASSQRSYLASCCAFFNISLLQNLSLAHFTILALLFVLIA